MRRFIIDKGRMITDTSMPFVIAEIGHNHEGDPQKAMRLIASAHDCKCGAVKFQKRDNKTLFTTKEYNRPYDNEQSYGKTYGEHREALELTQEHHTGLRTYAGLLGISYGATPFDLKSLADLVAARVKFLKVSSADLTNIPLLRAIGKTGLPVIISTGGGTIPEVKQALAAIGHGNVAILHCVATYPTEPQECNLRAITTLRAEFPDHIIGLSDHFNGILPSLMAGMYGAGIIEKHFKGDMEPKGGDARFSLDNHKMKDLTDSLKNMMVMSGTGAKFKNSKESEALRKMGKGIYAARKILKGEPVTENDITLKSPADGIPAWAWDAVLKGRNALCDIEEETPLDWRMLDGDLTISVAPSTIDTKGKL